jgi:caa(3)-type oxidase subunit IV
MDKHLSDKHHFYVYIALIALTFVNLGLSYVPFGDHFENILIALIIAGMQTCIISLFFMNLRFEKGVIKTAAIFPLALLVMLFCVLMATVAVFKWVPK